MDAWRALPLLQRRHSCTATWYHCTSHYHHIMLLSQCHPLYLLVTRPCSTCYQRLAAPCSVAGPFLLYTVLLFTSHTGSAV
jgi:hypothetical protein